ncbi:putative hydrolase, alpha/beta fold family [Diaporthe sp. PMI_573]|nr:putative hydrolase, alpha/beta fold family [Diaporthaceae sp. PMI_573]
MSDTMYDPILDQKVAQTPSLEITYYKHGPPTGWPVVLSHGFPYSPHAFDGVVPRLTAQGARVIMPYLQGFAPTAFRSPHTRRTGQQAALGSDIIGLLDALSIKRAVLARFD